MLKNVLYLIMLMNLLEYFNKVCSNEEYYNFHHNTNIEIGMWVRHNLNNNENDN